MVTKQKKFISASKTAFFCNIFVTKVGYIGYNVDYQLVTLKCSFRLKF